MADTQRTLAQLEALLADNTVSGISAQDIRDMLKSLTPEMGSLYLSAAIETVIAANNTWTKALGTTLVGSMMREFSMPSDGVIQYDGAEDRHFHIACSISTTSQGSNQVVRVAIAKNGTPLPGWMRKKIGTGTDEESTALHADAMMSTGDQLAIYLMNETSAGNLTLTAGYLFGVGMIV